MRRVGELSKLAGHQVRDLLTDVHRMVADPLHLLEIVMPCMGGAAFIVARKDTPRSNANRPAVIRGFGEHIQCKSPSYADDMIVTPIGPASMSPRCALST